MSGIDPFLVRGLDLIEAAGTATDEQMSTDRAEYIRTKVRTALDALAQDALYWNDVPTTTLAVEPLWAELRDAVVFALFGMDREQAEDERNAEYVRENCL